MQFSLIFFSFISANNLPPFVTFKNFDFTVLGISFFFVFINSERVSLFREDEIKIYKITRREQGLLLFFLQRDNSIRKRAKLLYYSNAHRDSASLYSDFLFALLHDTNSGGEVCPVFFSEKEATTKSFR